MKGMCVVAHLAFVGLLGLCLNYPNAQADTVYLSTFNLNTVLEFDSTGNQSTFATASSGLNDPYGLAFDSSGSLCVANSGGGSGGSDMEVFNSNGAGSVLTNLASGEFFGLASDGRGDLYASDIANNAIYKFDSSGISSIFVNSGLYFPDAIACDSNGNLYVANAGSNTIVEFNSNGAGSVFATAASGLRNPEGLAFDANGNLYVANEGNNTIEKFTLSGQESIFTSTNLLSAPIGLAFGSDGELYVANHGNGEILEFNSSGVGSVFASGLSGVNDLAIEVPEPSSLLLLALSAMTLVSFLKRHRRSCSSLVPSQKPM